MKKYKYTILTGLIWFVFMQIALYAVTNNWVMNDWVKTNLYTFALFGWALPAFIAMGESF